MEVVNTEENSESKEAPQMRDDLLGQWVSKLAILDCETTGLSMRDELIEIAIIVCNVIRPDMVLERVDYYSGLREPSRHITASASAVNGLTMKMLEGQMLDEAKIDFVLRETDFLVCHNVKFDRRMVVSVLPSLRHKNWLCSLRGIDWHRLGYFSRSLGALLSVHKVVNDLPHRAIGDAMALVKLLNVINPVTKQTYLAHLLRRARCMTHTGLYLTMR